jgi:transcriptional regulator
VLRTSFDAPRSDREWQDFLRHQRFCQVVAAGTGREIPVITPTHYIFDGDKQIEFYVHRSNPLLQALTENPVATLTVVDASSFIPSSWNSEPGEDPTWSASTSYYAAAHATGETSLMTGEQLADLLNRQTREFQPEVKIQKVEMGSSYFGRALAAIVGVRIVIKRVEAKFKFGGNRTARHRLQIAQNLLARGEKGDAAAVFHPSRTSFGKRSARQK